jgi:hypothetical protein
MGTHGLYSGGGDGFQGIAGDFAHVVALVFVDRLDEDGNGSSS